MYRKRRARSWMHKSKNCVFDGYPDHKKGYKFYDSVFMSIVVSRDVKFLESQLLKDSFLVTELSGGEEFSSQQKQITTEIVQDEEGAKTIPDDTTVVQEEPVLETVTEEPQVQPTYERTFMNSLGNLPDKRRRKPAAVCCVANEVVKESKTLKSALISAHSEEWMKAAETEFQSLTKMKTWQSVPRESRMDRFQKEPNGFSK